VNTHAFHPWLQRPGPDAARRTLIRSVIREHTSATHDDGREYARSPHGPLSATDLGGTKREAR
jgi:hypothetical protein